MPFPKKPILCFDFDGVIHSYTSGWKGADMIPDPPVLGAIEALFGYLEHFTVCIHSSRFSEASQAEVHGGIGRIMLAVRDWFIDNGVPEDRVWALADRNLNSDAINLCATKPSAFLTIDDRAITFRGTFPDPDELKRFNPWNKEKPQAIPHEGAMIVPTHTPAEDTDDRTVCAEPGCGEPVERSPMSRCENCGDHACERHRIHRTGADGEPHNLCLECREPSDPWGPVA